MQSNLNLDFDGNGIHVPQETHLTETLSLKYLCISDPKNDRLQTLSPLFSLLPTELFLPMQSVTALILKLQRQNKSHKTIWSSNLQEFIR